MNTRPALIASVIGIVAISMAATAYVGVRALSWLTSSSALGGVGYYGINSVANNYATQGNYPAAIAEYDKMIAMRPNKQDGYMLRAMAEFRAHQFKPAIRDNTTALNLLTTRAGIEEVGFNPNASYQQKLNCVPEAQASLYYNRAVVYDNLNDLPHAIADYTADLAIHPHDADAHQNRAWACLKTKQYDLGISDCAANIARHPKRVVDYSNRGQLYAAKGDTSHAIADFNTAIALKPTDPQYYELLSQVYMKTRQYAKDEANWKMATEVMPQNSLSWGNYGWAQYQAGHLPASIASSQHAVQIDPSATFAKANIALCYAIANQWDQAAPIYRDVIGRHDKSAVTGALGDVRDALKTHPASPSLRKAAALLTDA
ncbi:hypothetical protein CCAX7_20160 [Capsulimonas corticalis]|uniref:Uncharacterized protein n=1 Tax=Capsulimonas corticalis TaxID=2219043 RepID=A0A402D2L5_9BACT|nr:tetratricopeptide repeat protein [Capsulimonas corticalis]BDI29965.1 hypothetical protein CCAX7_20160 [Capsulimonas corticalis]